MRSPPLPKALGRLSAHPTLPLLPTPALCQPPTGRFPPDGCGCDRRCILRRCTRLRIVITVYRCVSASLASLGAQPLHGDVSQNQRDMTLKKFREGRFSVLVATGDLQGRSGCGWEEERAGLRSRRTV